MRKTARRTKGMAHIKDKCVLIKSFLNQSFFINNRRNKILLGVAIMKNTYQWVIFKIDFSSNSHLHNEWCLFFIHSTGIYFQTCYVLNQHFKVQLRKPLPLRGMQILEIINAACYHPPDHTATLCAQHCAIFHLHNSVPMYNSFSSLLSCTFYR